MCNPQTLLNIKDYMENDTVNIFPAMLSSVVLSTVFRMPSLISIDSISMENVLSNIYIYTYSFVRCVLTSIIGVWNALDSSSNQNNCFFASTERMCFRKHKFQHYLNVLVCTEHFAKEKSRLCCSKILSFFNGNPVCHCVVILLSVYLQITIFKIAFRMIKGTDAGSAYDNLDI